MNATLVATGIAASHGEKTLFSDVSFVLSAGDVLGLVGPNGAGKSSLLQILAGLRQPDAGSVARNPPDATVGYLPQERGAPNQSLAEFLAHRTGVAQAQRQMDDAAAALANGVLGAEDGYSIALEQWLNLGGADLDDRIATACAEAGLALDPSTLMGQLSGGQSARAGLASLILSRFDVVLLDEPTNDLDLQGLDRLEHFVSGLRVGTAVISHDREFLARTVTTVLELDLAQQAVRLVDGGYEAYLAEREVQRRHERANYEQYADKVDSLGERARMQRAWMDKGVANARRKAPDSDKIGRKFRSESTEKQAAKARQTERMISRLEEVAEPRKEWQLKLEIATAPRSGSVAATANSAVLSRAGFTLGPVNLQIDWADRVVITGANGSGKSTLLALLLGQLRPDVGTAGLGPGVIVGVLDQARALFDSDLVLTRVLGEVLPELQDAPVRTLLAKFGLRAEHVNRAARSLSPGERTRAALAILQARQVNLLVLDEPTNHLDVAAIEQLESALDSFTGTVLLVSHDRRLLSTVRSNRRLELTAGKLTEL